MSALLESQGQTRTICGQLQLGAAADVSISRLPGLPLADTRNIHGKLIDFFGAGTGDAIRRLVSGRVGFRRQTPALAVVDSDSTVQTQPECLT